MSLCDDLKQQLAGAQAQLANDQQALSNANSQFLLDQASVFLDDQNHPAELTLTTVPTRLAQLQGQQPPSNALIALYWTIMSDLSAIGGLSVRVSDDQATIAGIQQQIADNNC